MKSCLSLLSVAIACFASASCRTANPSAVQEVGQVDPTESLNVQALLVCWAERDFEGFKFNRARIHAHVDPSALRGKAIENFSRMHGSMEFIEEGETYGFYMDGKVSPTTSTAAQTSDDRLIFRLTTSPIRAAKPNDNRRCSDFQVSYPRILPQEVDGTSTFSATIQASCVNLKAPDVNRAELTCRGNYGSDKNSPAYPHYLQSADRDKCFKVAEARAKAELERHAGFEDSPKIAIIGKRKSFYFSYGGADGYHGSMIIQTEPLNDTCRVLSVTPGEGYF